jgi:hypothetical protein
MYQFKSENRPRKEQHFCRLLSFLFIFLKTPFSDGLYGFIFIIDMVFSDSACAGANPPTGVTV